MSGLDVLGGWLGRLKKGRGSKYITFEEFNVLKSELASWVDLEPFRKGVVTSADGRQYSHDNADRNSLKAQAEFVLEALEEDGMLALVLFALADAISRPGSKIYKKSDREAGLPEPTEEEVLKFVKGKFSKWVTSEFVFDPTKAQKEVFWGDAVLYRVEAIISVTYVLLRILSHDSPGEALSYQWQPYFKDHFLVRLQEGWVKSLKAEGQEVPEHLLREDKTIIRHMHPLTVLKIWEMLS